MHPDRHRSAQGWSHWEDHFGAFTSSSPKDCYLPSGLDSFSWRTNRGLISTVSLMRDAAWKPPQSASAGGRLMLASHVKSVSAISCRVLPRFPRLDSVESVLYRRARRIPWFHPRIHLRTFRLSIIQHERNAHFPEFNHLRRKYHGTEAPPSVATSSSSSLFLPHPRYFPRFLHMNSLRNLCLPRSVGYFPGTEWLPHSEGQERIYGER